MDCRGMIWRGTHHHRQGMNKWYRWDHRVEICIRVVQMIRGTGAGIPYCGWTIGGTMVAGGTAVLDVCVQLGDELSFC